MMRQAALIVFFKVPQAGKVKTRLSPFLSSGEAAQLYACFVQDTFEKVCNRAFHVFGFVSGAVDEGSEIARFLAEKRVEVFEQVGDGLGERMSQSFQFCFERGFERVCIIGTDSPDLPLSMIERAFAVLEADAPTVSISGADDGGYVLLGMNRYFPEAFADVPYSSSETYLATLTQLSRTSAQVIELEKWYDVDMPSDLNRLSETLFAHHVPRTLIFLNHLFKNQLK
jgi:rSAM/selenodomain-associated transferase 1